jgi:hypothetical protein
MAATSDPTAATAVGASILGLGKFNALATPIVDLTVSVPVASTVRLLVSAAHRLSRKSLAEARQLVFRTVRADRQARSQETPSAGVGT